MENQPQIKNSKEIIAFLAERFPACFSLTGEAKPLKIGIFQDIINTLQDEMPISRTQLRVALRIYTSSWRYLHAIKVGAFRVNLAGENDVVIEQEHVDYALQQLKASKEKANANKKETPTKPKNASKKAVTSANKSSTAKVKSQPAAAATASAKSAKPAKAQSFTPIKDITTLQMGQSVKMMLGNNITQVIVTEIQKDSVKVQAPSGFELTVRVEHISN